MHPGTCHGHIEEPALFGKGIGLFLAQHEVQDGVVLDERRESISTLVAVDQDDVVGFEAFGRVDRQERNISIPYLNHDAAVFHVELASEAHGHRIIIVSAQKQDGLVGRKLGHKLLYFLQHAFLIVTIAFLKGQEGAVFVILGRFDGLDLLLGVLDDELRRTIDERLMEAVGGFNLA